MTKAELSKLWRQTHKVAHKAYQKKWKVSPAGRLCKYKWGAKSRGYKFELDFETFNSILKQSCHYCGKKESNGIDRIDSTRGYDMDNILPCCKICNVMKMIHSYDDFTSHIAKIYNHLLLK
jgi:hypothetical protein